MRGKGGHPANYTSPKMRHLLPELRLALGTAVTTEVATNDPDAVAIPWK